MDAQEIPLVEGAFQDCIDKDILRFIWKKEGNWRLGDMRLTVEYKSILNYAPRSEEDYSWRLVCANYTRDMTVEKVIQRTTLLMGCLLQSLSQDVNGILDEYKLVRK